MKEIPVLMSGPMVRAILDGRKTQTRRLVRERDCSIPLVALRAGTRWSGGGFWCEDEHGGIFTAPGRCTYGAVGDRLWVRETFTHITGNGIRVHYRADGEPVDLEGKVLPTEPGLPRWRPSIFMRRKESRITLEITEVRVQRLQEITAADACDEGALEVLDVGHPLRAECYAKHGTWTGKDKLDINGPFAGAVAAFATLWDSINGKRAPWSSNPWVWALSFKRLLP